MQNTGSFSASDFNTRLRNRLRHLDTGDVGVQISNSEEQCVKRGSMAEEFVLDDCSFMEVKNDSLLSECVLEFKSREFLVVFEKSLQSQVKIIKKMQTGNSKNRSKKVYDQ